MNAQFQRATASHYTFRESHGDRELIALYIGGKRAGFVDYDAARRLADRINALCDENEFVEELVIL